jgi:hypothetical protein
MWDPKLSYFQKEKLVNFLVGWVYFHYRSWNIPVSNKYCSSFFSDFIHHGLIGFLSDIMVWKSRAGRLN